MKPNIIFILADDMGYGDFSFFNDGLSRTPTLDNLIEEGICFTQSYAASPVCNPSRASLLTGKYPHRTGSIDTLDWYGLERLNLSEVTIADVLKNAGYKTGLIGKWHLGSFDMRYHPKNRGFDETVCFRGGMHDYYSWRLEYGETVVRSDGRYLTDVWTDEAVDFIKRNQKQPFFLHLAYNAPHTPLQVPAGELEIFKNNENLSHEVRTLYAMIHRMDSGIKKLLDTLKRLKLEENTIVVFSSDNGPELGRSIAGLERYNIGLKGSKCLVYEGGIRVPLVLKWPVGLDGSRMINTMVHFTDWFPTLLAMSGVSMPQGLDIDGYNILNMIRGRNQENSTKRFWQWNRYSPRGKCNAAVRDGKWKLVRPPIDKFVFISDDVFFPWLDVAMRAPEYFIANGLLQRKEPEVEIKEPPAPELYNICDDPFEENDLARKYPERVSKLLYDLDNWFEKIEVDRRSVIS
jgi:arylsulfatase A